MNARQAPPVESERTLGVETNAVLPTPTSSEVSNRSYQLQVSFEPIFSKRNKQMDGWDGLDESCTLS
jgi:hypothetical protein